MSDPEQQVEIEYTNHRGERRWRSILPVSLRFGMSPHHPYPQWLLHAHDIEKNAPRTFAMAAIHAWRAPAWRAPVATT